MGRLTTALVIVGLLLLVMALAERPLRRLPVSPAIVYLLVGFGAARLLGPDGWDPVADAAMLATVTEVVVLMSLFAVGLRLPLAPERRGWRLAVMLATGTMVVTILLATAAAAWLLALAWPAALALAAVLAPTDPVLASEVQIREDGDRDVVRLALTAEGGLNDGTALPATMLALGLLGLHELGDGGLRWLALDLLWPIGGGVALGALLGGVVARLLGRQLRRGHSPAWDELIYVGTVALGYGLARVTQTSAFLVVFAAGVSLLHMHCRHATARGDDLTTRLLEFGANCERLVEVATVLTVGVLLAWVRWGWAELAFAAVLVLLIRPLAVMATVRRTSLPLTPRRLVAWFGIRGVGSLFYLAFVLEHGVAGALADRLIAATLVAVALSIVLHGISATPLMAWYEGRGSRRRRNGPGPPG